MSPESGHEVIILLLNLSFHVPMLLKYTCSLFVHVCVHVCA